MSKAKRYGQNPKAFTMKGILLYLLPAPILITAIFSFLHGNSAAIITNSIAFGLFLLTAALARRGFLQEALYHDSTLVKAPKLPYKTVAALFLAIATFYTSYACTDNTLFLSILLALASFVGFYLYYGFDPRDDKLDNLPAGVDAQDLIEVTQNARTRLSALKSHKSKLKNFESKEHLQSIIMETESIVSAIEKDPSDLTRARKFFKIYLARTENITDEFIENLDNGNIDDTMIKNYNTLLKSVKETIKAQKEKLNDDDILRLDVQIEALTKQINHEGI